MPYTLIVCAGYSIRRLGKFLFNGFVTITCMLGTTQYLYAVDIYNYRPPIRGKSEEYSFQIPKGDEIYPYMVYSGHVYDRAKYCPSESEYYCVFSIRYAFAVPKDLFDKEPTEWEVDGYLFKRIGGRINLLILGKEFDDVYLIETPPEAFYLGKSSGKSTLSLYSPTAGLLGFVDIRLDDFYWLTGPVGFGAQGVVTAEESAANKTAK